MKRSFALTLFWLAACSSGSSAVDMKFSTRVHPIENTCVDTPLPADTLIDMDMRLLLDGRTEMVGLAEGIPYYGGYPNLKPDDGDVNAVIQVHDMVTGRDFPYRINGRLDMDELHLTLDSAWHRSDADMADCHIKTRLDGSARGFLDPGSLDGVYPLQTDYYGIVCDGDALPTVPIGTQVMRIDSHATKELNLVIEQSFLLTGPLPDRKGNVDWDGTFMLSDFNGTTEAPGTLKGKFAPGGVDAILEFNTVNIAPNCRFRYGLSGRKRVASPKAVGGEYRAVVRSFADCFGLYFTEESQLELVEWGDDQVAIYDTYGALMIGRDGSTLHASEGSEEEGAVITVTGSVTPPFLKYSFAERFLVADGTWCNFGWDVDAVSRFLPDQSWTPEFSPAPTKTMSLAAMRSVKDANASHAAGRAMPSAARFAPPSYGPLSHP